jgi:signal transduction histidine kinase
MLEDSDRLQRLVEQVLLAARSPRQRLLHRVPVDVRALTRDCVQISRSRHQLGEEALRFEDHTPPALETTVLGDADELRAAVLNLVDNAVHYSRDAVRVTVELLSLEPARIAVRVTDEGIGISETDLKRIFRRFYRIPEAVAMRLKGTGLGLFIVSAVARKHGGRVFAESEGPGRGSTFTLQLPLGRQA